MQTVESELDLTPSTLETPSLMIPNIVLNPSPMKFVHDSRHTNISAYNEITSIPKSSSVANTADTKIFPSISSADAKVSKIEEELKQGFAEPRRPTPSPFQKISGNKSFFMVDKFDPVVSTGESAKIEVLSTPDVREIFYGSIIMMYFHRCVGTERNRNIYKYK